MKKIILIINAVILALCLNACKSGQRTATGTTEATPAAQNADTEPTGKYWKLITLNGAPIEVARNVKEPHILLHPQGSRITGSAGCNNIAGSFHRKEAGKIIFSQVVATRKMCPDMETENNFLKALNKVEGYAVKGDTLTLTDAKATPIANFIVVWLD